MKWLKRLFRILIALVALAIVLTVLALVFINPIAKKTIKVMAPRKLGVPVEVEQISLAPLRGKATIRGLRIGNPQGYSDRPLLLLGELKFDLDTWTLFGNKPVLVNHVIIRHLHVSYEVSSGVSNFEMLQKRLACKRGTVVRREGGPARKVVVELFESRSGQVTYSASFMADKSVQIDLPDIDIRDLGKDSGGVSPDEAGRKITGEIMSGIGRAVTSASGAAIGAGGEVLNDTGKAVGHGLKSIGKGVLDIFR